jgi:DNA-binding NarL/FixJ family response regulator
MRGRDPVLPLAAAGCTYDTAATAILTDEERTELKALAGRRKTAQALALRARIVLACAEGSQNKEVAAKLGVIEATVGKWRRRFAAGQDCQEAGHLTPPP